MPSPTDLGTYYAGVARLTYRWAGQLEVQTAKGTWVESALGAVFPKPQDAAQARALLAEAPWLTGPTRPSTMDWLRRKAP